jgi:ribosome biogenesis GTPase
MDQKQDSKPHVEEGAIARVIYRNREHYLLMTHTGEVKGGLSGKFLHTHKISDYPVVGDRVFYTSYEEDVVRITDVLPRTSKFSRKEAGRVTNEQVLAANIDIVFIVTGLDDNFNISRILRYRTEVLQGGAKPVIILNKLDICSDLEDKLTALRAVVADDPIHPISTVTGDGMDAIKAYLTESTMVAFFGSSGVGKSSIMNLLVNKEQMVIGAVSAANGKGKHTTTAAELCCLDGGAMLIDTPGMRELQLWCQEATVDVSFADVSTLAKKCRFENCKHKQEPGCAVKLAIRMGTLEQRQYDSYVKLKNEARFFEAKQKDKEKINQKTSKKTEPRQNRVIYFEE